MCNAWNHSIDCDCGFGGGVGGWIVASAGSSSSHLAWSQGPLSGGWSADGPRTLVSFTNPNAHCPVCGAPVYFYKSPFGGRVFFDDLGPPWPKHPCTDNGVVPSRITRLSATLVDCSRPRLVCRDIGWNPLLFSKVRSSAAGTFITGDLREQFLDLMILEMKTVDHESPVLVLLDGGLGGFYRVSFLDSDHFAIKARSTAAVEARFAACPKSILLGALEGDAASLLQLGQHALYQLGDFSLAWEYLRRAFSLGSTEACYDLAVLACFPAQRRNTVY